MFGELPNISVRGALALAETRNMLGGLGMHPEHLLNDVQRTHDLGNAEGAARRAYHLPGQAGRNGRPRARRARPLTRRTRRPDRLALRRRGPFAD